MAKRKKINYGDRRAHQRNVAHAQYQKEEAARKAWWAAHGKTTLIISAIALVVIIAAWALCNWFWAPGAALSKADLDGVQDTWVVTDLNPRTNVNAGSSNVDSGSYGKSPLYYHLATFAPLEGYTQDPGFTFSKDANNQDQHYTANEPDGVLEAVYVFGIANKDATKHTGDMISTMSISNVTGEAVEATIGGHETTYVYFTYNQPMKEGDTVQTAYGSLCVCINTPHDACVMVVLNSYILPVDQVPTAEEMVAAAEAVLPNLTIAE